MTRLLLPLGALLSLVISGCAQMEVADFQANIRLPASQDCYGINVVSGREQRRSRKQCDDLVARAVLLDSENWKLLRESIQRNCQQFECKNIIGAFDGLFLSLDKALQALP